MQYLREGSSTIVQLGPFLDKSDALTEETALTIEVELSKTVSNTHLKQPTSDLV